MGMFLDVGALTLDDGRVVAACLLYARDLLRRG
jgi:hypothetical protein